LSRVHVNGATNAMNVLEYALATQPASLTN
jgi:hypothetical protein